MQNADQPIRQLDNQTVGNAGLYFVCYRLSVMGWNVMPTARNARGVDIMAYSEDGTRKLTIQVKALSKRSPVPLGKHLRNFIADFVVICRGVASKEPECFVLTPGELDGRVHRGEKESRISYWLQPSAYEIPEFHEAWSKIGSGH